MSGNMAQKFNNRDHHPQFEPTQISIDNMSAIALTKNLVTHGEASTFSKASFYQQVKKKRRTTRLLLDRIPKTIF